jgi:hypothetical protein
MLAPDGWQAARISAMTSNIAGRAASLSFTGFAFIFVNNPFKICFILIFCFLQDAATRIFVPKGSESTLSFPSGKRFSGENVPIPLLRAWSVSYRRSSLAEVGVPLLKIRHKW